MEVNGSNTVIQVHLKTFEYGEKGGGAKSVRAKKWKSEEYRSCLFCLSMKLQFHNT